MRGLSRRLRVDVEHYLPSGRVTHLTFATADDRHKAFSASLVVVQRANPLTYPLTVRVVAVADISCPANSRTAVDQCVSSLYVTKVNVTVVRGSVTSTSLEQHTSFETC